MFLPFDPSESPFTTSFPRSLHARWIDQVKLITLVLSFQVPPVLWAEPRLSQLILSQLILSEGDRTDYA